MSGAEKLHAHLARGIAQVCRCWAVTRRDGRMFGFTDHDRELAFEGRVFKPDTGLSALAVQQSTGLSVDNTEAVGALRSADITEEDIAAGRFDDAEVLSWLVDWSDVEARKILFRGTIGEIRRSGGAFQAELRGLSEALNRPLGRVFQAPCRAVLGDAACGFDLNAPGYIHVGPVERDGDGRVFDLGKLNGFDPEWFQRGRLKALSGDAKGLSGAIKRDGVNADGHRIIELWEPFRAAIRAGDTVKLWSGCDKRFETCRLKFNNVINFQGFPDIPEDDWVMVHPTMAKRQGGGSRR